MKLVEFQKTFPGCERLTAKKLISIMESHDMEGIPAIDFYQHGTNSRCIAITVENYTFYVGLPASLGNKKIAACCLVNKLEPIVTCPNHKECAYSKDGKTGACYAILDTLRFNALHYLQLLYTYLAMHDPVKYCEIIEMQIKMTGCAYYRIHESGDFFSQEYVDAWMDLIKRNPDVMFYTYTKSDFVFENLPNLNIVDSLIWFNGKSYINYGPKEYIDWLHELTGIPICPYGKDNIKCMGNCKACAHCKHMLFYQHGGGWVMGVYTGKNKKAVTK